MAVNTPSDDWKLYELDRQLTAALRGGTRAMRQAGKILLPQEPKETPQNYTNRLKRSVLTNFYRKTADKFSGKITKKAPTLLDETPQEIVDIEDNIDNQGKSVAQLTEEALSHAIDDGVVFLFVDAPQMPATTDDEAEEAPVRTRGQDEREGFRPYVRIVTSSQLIGWNFENVGGTNVLKDIRIHEMVTQPDPDDPFNDKKVEQIRHVFPLRHDIWQKVNTDDGKEEWVIVEVIPTDFEVIPLVPLYTNEIKYLVGEPLFLDLANMNVAHYQSDSDQSNIVHVIRVPILFGTGLQEAGEDVIIEIGPNSVVHGEIGSELGYVEHTGKAAEVGFKSLERLEENITRMGADIILNRRPGNPTATQRTLDQAEADSEMATVSTNVEDAWAEAFVFLGQAFGVTDEDAEPGDAGGVNMNKDFNIGLGDVTAVQELIKMRTTGDISQKTLWFELKRYGILSEDFVEDDEEALLEDEKEANMEREARAVQLISEAENGENDPTDPDDSDPDDDE